MEKTKENKDIDKGGNQTRHIQKQNKKISKLYMGHSPAPELSNHQAGPK